MILQVRPEIKSFLDSIEESRTTHDISQFNVPSDGLPHGSIHHHYGKRRRRTLSFDLNRWRNDITVVCVEYLWGEPEAFSISRWDDTV